PAAQPEALEILKNRTDATSEALLGGTFHNALAGVAFQVPSRVQQVSKASVGEEVARFASADKAWELVVNKASTGQPLPLTGGAPKDRKDAKAPASQPSQLGLMEVVAARLKQNNPGVDIVRQDVVNLGEHDAGLIAARVSSTSARRLMQQAIIQANDQLYYTFTMTTPAAKDAAGPDASDAGEQVAVESFRQMLDTVKLLDRAAIKDDQNERLVRTRALFVNVTASRLKEVLIPEQWLRLQRGGKDIGYTYVVEEPDAQGAHEGIKVGIRSRTYPGENAQVDGETWYFISLDRKHETWSNLVWVQDLATKKSDQFTEFGSADRRLKRFVDTGGQVQVGEARDPKQPPVVEVEPYTLHVQSVGQKGNAEPLTQNLPPFYLPQAIGHLLPRLVPRSQPKTYLFATYVSDRRAVMMRYVDIGNEVDVELGGQRVRAVPVSDRIGLEGSATVHYVSPEGKYLGSVNKDSQIQILPTDAATLQKIWANRADLTRPRVPEQPK
ncbi:MAG TPA: hypothetical protein VER17_15450, partial [Tepidisphaeraceae bacterium]|nr:hypothetical protein [Tepidisphaeraceae bacterium]